ncbi:hypothetical protein [Amycolatopsis balhimycina]|uniref:hypothetical protein n=1 Tax=Amycolatopsis balhimycina TaxID=208443 RepID=UPI000F767011|nr:hypothetical protein [Amycolatopsis balhimycina]
MQWFALIVAAGLATSFAIILVRTAAELLRSGFEALLGAPQKLRNRRSSGLARQRTPYVAPNLPHRTIINQYQESSQAQRWTSGVANFELTLEPRTPTREQPQPVNEQPRLPYNRSGERSKHPGNFSVNQPTNAPAQVRRSNHPEATPLPGQFSNDGPILSVTLAVEPAQNLPPSIRDGRRFCSIDIRSTDVLAIGDSITLDMKFHYKIKKIEIDMNGLVGSLSSKALGALRDLVADPSDDAANRRFRETLPLSAQHDDQPWKTVHTRPNARTKITECNVLIEGDNRRIPIKSRITITKGKLPLAALLRSNGQLTSQLARALREPEIHKDFTRALTRSTREIDSLKILQHSEFKPSAIHDSPIICTGNGIFGSGLPAVTVGEETRAKLRTTSSLNSILSDAQRGLADINGQLNPTPPPPAVDTFRIPGPGDGISNPFG